MTIRYECAECGASLNIKDELAGTQGHCPKCRKEFTVPAPEAAASARSGATAAKGGSGFDEDDITAILSGNDGASAAAVSSREKQEAGDGAYAVSGGDADDSDPQDQKKKKSASKKARSREDEERIADAASVARALMGRGGKTEGDDSGEPPKRRFGKIFGAGPEKRDDDETFSTGEIAGYFAKRAVPGVGVVVVCVLLYWLGSLMMGGSNIPPLGRVTGMVTLDGKPLANAVVTFIPMSEEANKEAKGSGSSAYTDASGRYDLQYSPEEFGALIGKHLISITALDPNTGRELLPPAYNSNTTLTEVVKPGSNTIDLPLQSQPTGN
jgi:hypothetical protein